MKIIAMVTYSGVVAPEVSQGEVVFIKVSLGETLHQHNIHTLDFPLAVETTPTIKERV